MSIGIRIANLRKERRWTQLQTSTLLGISRAALSHYEKNRREPDSETLTRFADLYKVSIDYLVGRTSLSQHTITNDIRAFVDQLELADEELIIKYNLTIDGKLLTSDEMKKFIAYVRAERTVQSL